MMRNGIQLEVCVDSVESALAAQEGGADGVELCANLSDEGTTPSAGVVGVARRELSIRLNVMIRPHRGDFFASDHDLEVMKRDIGMVKALGVDGVVFGLLKPDGTVDFDSIGVLTELAKPLQVTFHRAIDLLPDPLLVLNGLISLGIKRILTSGGSETAMGGVDRIHRIAMLSRGKAIVAAAGGVSHENVVELVGRTGVDEIHVGSAVHRIETLSSSPLTTRKSKVDAALVSRLVDLIPG